MTFMRTQSGVVNFRRFVGADILIYTEGKNNTSGGEDQVFDAMFYMSLIKSIYPEKSIVIKCIGSKKDALEYASNLHRSETLGSVVIIDRDGEDLICSLLPLKGLIYTDGYSWENDFWTPTIAREILEELACTDRKSDFLMSQIYLVRKRLAVISALDICSHINKETILPKNGGGCGIGFKFASLRIIPLAEARRLISKYRRLGASTCPLCRSILPAARRENPDRAIQGHLWEHVILNLINFAIPGVGTRMPCLVIKNLAMSKFKKNPAAYMTHSTFNYYRQELELRFG